MSLCCVIFGNDPFFSYDHLFSFPADVAKKSPAVTETRLLRIQSSSIGKKKLISCNSNVKSMYNFVKKKPLTGQNDM